MRLIAFLMVFFVGSLAFGQLSQVDFEKKYKYDMVHIDRTSVTFNGETFWLRGATYAAGTVRLTFFKKGDTPTTYTESLQLLQTPKDLTLEELGNQLLEATRAKWVRDPEVFTSDRLLPTKVLVQNVYFADKPNNLFENTITQIRQPEKAPWTILIHTKRLKLSAVNADQELATREVGSRAGEWMKALDGLQFDF